MKSMTKDFVLLRKQRLNIADNFKTFYVQIRGFADKNNIKEEIPRLVTFKYPVVTYLTIQKKSSTYIQYMQ